MLLTQDEQIACVENSSRLLAAGGRFVVEAFVPEPQRYAPYGRLTELADLTMDRVTVLFSVHDPLNQRVDGQIVTLGPGNVSLHPSAVRYVWPSELDLMAKTAGLTLEARYESWSKAPFVATSRDHVSVFRKN
jgi:hypothetical protein